MSLAKHIITDPHMRRVVLMTKHIGYMNLTKSLASSLKDRKDKNESLWRYILPNLWKNWGVRDAVIDHKGKITFSEYHDRTLTFANFLYQNGFVAGDSLAVLLHNDHTWFVAMGATTLMGINMPLLNWHLKEEELIDCINACSPKALLVDERYIETILRIKDQLKTVNMIFCTGETNVSDDVINYDQVVKEKNTSLPPGGLCMSQDFFSGGTTGTPKYMTFASEKMVSQFNEDRRGVSKEFYQHLKLKQISANARLGMTTIKGQIRSLVPGPLYHAGTQIAVFPFYFGGTISLMYKFTAEGFLKAIAEQKINISFVAPVMLERVLRLSDDIKNKYDLSSMHALICAAAPCPPEVKKNINQLFRNQGNKRDVFYEFYGSSETAMVSVLTPEDYQKNDERYRSVGKIVGGICGIYDEENKKWLPDGSEGKVLLKTVRVYGMNYSGKSEGEMRECFVNVDGELWYDDGLIGYLDSDNYLYLTSRTKEMVISGGVNIYPNEIENIIKLHPDIENVSVVRAPDEDLGEVPAAVIVRQKEKEVTPDQIVDFCKEHGLYGFKIPKKIIFVSDLPITPNGKILKREIEKIFWNNDRKFG